ncbi:lytic murein transglycosylase B [Rhodoferax sp.]|uniref:lytic murein transglycosylase B n=1 Tax=Rhodoferax sp. TaxID=50421 RepID=UPI00262ECAEC|nr:lytic murein transglycosylase B [Rhodoferax sp.]MDD2919434.1 lytic murein transglycosylase B [Rhodoferax sp.]
MPGPSYAQRLDALQVADDMAMRRDLDPVWVRQTISQARYVAAIAKAVTPPAVGVAKNWQLYRSRFVEPLRIKAGVAFWQTHGDTLKRAEQATGVPAEIIVGILGVETIYGQQTGNYRVLDALATLSFDFPASHPRAPERSAYFKGELEQFLSWTQRSGLDPLSIKGSYAGAMGWPQFMPSSWHQYAIDFDGDGAVNLFDSPADAIGSVANYFKAFGWQPGLATHFPVAFDAQKLDMDALMAPDILPTFSVDSFQAKGAVLSGAALAHTGKLALIELQMGDAPPVYVAGTDNFYAITRYNWSSYYAMAVIELGQAVAQAMAAQAVTPAPAPENRD